MDDIGVTLKEPEPDGRTKATQVVYLDVSSPAEDIPIAAWENKGPK